LPTVDIVIAACNRIEWDKLDDLDRDDGDARVVAEILHTRGIPAGRKVLLSHDIYPIAMARDHGLQTRKMDDRWLLEPEPSPQERELARVKSRLKEFENTAPALVASLTFGAEGPLDLFQVNGLSEAERSALVNRILAENPQRQNPFSLDSGYPHRYAEYRNTSVPTYAATLHRRLEVHYNQLPFELVISNEGHRQAENLVVTLRPFGGLLHTRFVYGGVFGPIPPVPKYYPDLDLPSLADRIGALGPRELHEVATTVIPDSGGHLVH
jgi:hypothetical protein